MTLLTGVNRNIISKLHNSLKLYYPCKFTQRNIHYTQGQSPEPSLREYFYYIDHQGMVSARNHTTGYYIRLIVTTMKETHINVDLFLDDSRMKNFTSCFKDKKFLVFFFKKLKMNTTNRYPEFPYLSLCGRERNFVRCDDCPLVFTHVIKTITTSGTTENRLCYGHAGDLLSVKFEPERVHMSPETGRVYHPAPTAVGSIGLVQSKLAIEFSKYFRFDNGEYNSPTHFTWDMTSYTLKTDWYVAIKELTTQTV
uniref:Uncharacterized protein n=1 Tax=Timema monikensis TaxID=170555 RepID=A0A7R9E6D0_9NEOP|nr:unnamed protein product [Timema monikensis]